MQFTLFSYNFFASVEHSFLITFPALRTLYFGTSSQKSFTYWSFGFDTISSGVPICEISPSFIIAM